LETSAENEIVLVLILVLVLAFNPDSHSGKSRTRTRTRTIQKTKNLHPPAKRRMKAFSESARKRFDASGLILLFDGEVAE